MCRKIQNNILQCAAHTLMKGENSIAKCQENCNEGATRILNGRLYCEFCFNFLYFDLKVGTRTIGSRRKRY
jgi:hypothetical protein